VSAPELIRFAAIVPLWLWSPTPGVGWVEGWGAPVDAGEFQCVAHENGGWGVSTTPDRQGREEFGGWKARAL
jgi:hypothetical protein